MGAGKWREEYSQSLKGKIVVIVPDNDAPGRQHAAAVALSLLPVAAQVYTATVPAPHKDVSDWGPTKEALEAWAAQGTPLETPEHVYAAWPEAAPPEDSEEHAAAPEPPPPPPPPADDAPLAAPEPEPPPRAAPARESQVTKLLSIVADLELWRNDKREGYATVPHDGHYETYPIKSGSFRNYIVGRFLDATGTALRVNSLTEAITNLDAKATHQGATHEVFIRIGAVAGRYYLDLGTDSWECVEMSPEGWRVLPVAPVRFTRSPGMLALPVPTRAPGGEEAIRNACNVRTGDDADLILGWLMSCLRPVGPFPVLILQSEQGSGKSTLTRYLRGLVDPNKAPLRSQPREGRDLSIAAKNGWILSYDNISHIDEEMSDMFCRISTGGGCATRALYTDSDEHMLDAQRPTILNGIEEIATRADLIDRSVLVQLSPISPTARLTEREFWARADSTRAATLGWLLDVACSALAREGTFTLPTLPRMADFALWVAAAEPGFGWDDGYFQEIYSRNRKEAVDMTLDASAVGRHLVNLVKSQAGPWNGTAAALLDVLDKAASYRELHSKGWPQMPRGLTNALRRIVPTLRVGGIRVTFTREGKRGGRLIQISMEE